MASALAAAGPAAATVPEAVVFDGSSGNRAAPIVLVLHGVGSNGRQLRRRSAFDTWARAAGVVAIYPTAPGGLWNDGRWRPLHRPDIAGRNDVTALLDLVARIAGPAGAARPLYVIGQSVGGGMALRLACAVPGRISGIAVIGTKIAPAAPCEHPDVPVPAIFFYGTADEIAPPAGRAAGGPLAAERGAAFSAADTIAIWRARNRCGRPATVTAANPDPDDGVSLRRVKWPGCAAPLRYVEIDGGGHSWPGARPNRPIRPRRAPERTVRDIDAGEAALAFWLGHAP